MSIVKKILKYQTEYYMEKSWDYLVNFSYLKYLERIQTLQRTNLKVSRHSLLTDFKTKQQQKKVISHSISFWKETFVVHWLSALAVINWCVILTVNHPFRQSFICVINTTCPTKLRHSTELKPKQNIFCCRFNWKWKKKKKNQPSISCFISFSIIFKFCLPLVT